MLSMVFNACRYAYNQVRGLFSAGAGAELCRGGQCRKGNRAVQATPRLLPPVLTDLPRTNLRGVHGAQVSGQAGLCTRIRRQEGKCPGVSIAAMQDEPGNELGEESLALIFFRFLMPPAVISADSPGQRGSFGRKLGLRGGNPSWKPVD